MSPVRVGLAVDMNLGYFRSALEGIASYAREGEQWALDHALPTAAGLEGLLERRPDGIILGTTNVSVYPLFERLSVPVVKLGISSDVHLLSQVGNDSFAIGELGASYFLRKGYRNFAFAALIGQRVDLRAQGFVQALERVGFSCSVLDQTIGPQEVTARAERLEKWLLSLPRPIAILCSNDFQGWELIECCSRLGIRVPEEMSVLGVDNDSTVCALSAPPLSSIQTGAESVGYEAARALEMHVKMPGSPPIRLEVPPVRVVERASTDALANLDPVVVRSLTYMREKLKSPTSIDQLAKEFACSRRKLERLFRTATGLAPAQVWTQLRVAESERLLADTDLSIEDIAYVVGFRDGSQLSATFRRLTALSPTAFRKRARP
ncbi:MAG: DNA-binding transcriptional regulator [Polyangiaceae bacterium]|nr:DNA-binding transcriptional regulator [Polyangiaceae bacterium]